MSYQLSGTSFLYEDGETTCQLSHYSVFNLTMSLLVNGQKTKPSNHDSYNLVQQGHLLRPQAVIRLGPRHAPLAHHMKLWSIGLLLCALSGSN